MTLYDNPTRVDHEPTAENEFAYFNKTLQHLRRVLNQVNDPKNDPEQLALRFSDKLRILGAKEVRELKKAKEIVDECRGVDWRAVVSTFRAGNPQFADELLAIRDRLVKAYDQVTANQNPTESHRWLLHR